MIVRLTSLAIALVCAALSIPHAVDAETVRVMFQEGVTRAFPVVRSLTGQKLAQGDLVQVARGDVVDSRMTFRFTDGSLYDEHVVFSQAGVFSLLRYRLVQRGPSFPETLDASIDREHERYEVRYRADEESPEQLLTGRFALPPDAYNGMLSLLLKNLPADESAIVQVVAFTPKPRLVKLQLLPLGNDPVPVSDSPMRVIRWAIRPQLGLFASLLVADIPDAHCWILPGDAPAFLKAEGPLYFQGPIWRIEPN
ncbi:MAG TPA: hypothetical protein VK548_16130 [Candidatus Acidoferrum sp.]|nr:hypothetical protein [Candidatus Acidoferrum sp.]